MLYLCPNCGHSLPRSLTDGIAFCAVCNTSMDTSRSSRLMSAAWMIYRQNPESIDNIAKATKLTPVETELVEAFLMTNCHSIEEFRAALLELGLFG